jgi:hypothetical protein
MENNVEEFKKNIHELLSLYQKNDPIEELEEGIWEEVKEHLLKQVEQPNSMKLFIDGKPAKNVKRIELKGNEIYVESKEVKRFHLVGPLERCSCVSDVPFSQCDDYDRATPNCKVTRTFFMKTGIWT